MATFVLVHGGWHGGWCWREVARRLRAAGHEVWTPTLSGLADRAHLLTPKTDLETHIDDVVGLLVAEELAEAVLVGHSYGGMVITGAADRAPDRVGHLVYLDAFVPEDGESVLGLLAPERRAFYETSARERGDGWRCPPPPAAALGVTDEPTARWLAGKLTDQPLRTLAAPIRLAGRGGAIPRTYIHCTGGTVAPSFAPFAAQARDSSDWTYRELATGHDAMVIAPDQVADLVLPVPAAAGSSPAGKPATGSGDPVRASLQRLLLAQVAAQALYAVARYGVPDLLSDGPRPLVAIADGIGAEPAALGRLLRALVGYGVFTQPAPGVFGLGPAGGWLRDERPNSVRPAALLYGEEYRRALDGIVESVRTGEPAFERGAGLPFFAYLAVNPEVGARFDRNMAGRHAARNAAVAELVADSGIGTLVDLGGGDGALLRAILVRRPGLRGVLFDRPEVIERERRTAAEPGRPTIAAGGLELAAGDLFEAVPTGHDGYLLASILHDWDDERALAILRIVRRAIPADGRLLIVEEVLPDGVEPSPAYLLDLLMLVLTGGRERTLDEYRTLLAAAGFGLVSVLPTGAGASVVEALPLPA